MKVRDEVLQRFPFVLPEHAIKEQSEFDSLNVEPWEEVGRVGGRTIRRKPKSPLNLATAERPPQDEIVNTKRLIKSSDLEADTRTAAELAETAYEAMTRLAIIARAGDGKALWHFSDLTNLFAQSLSQMVASNPAAFRPIARLCSKWPMMMSKHPLNCDDRDILDLVQLGDGTPMRLDKFSKIKPDKAAQVAVRLIEHIQSVCARVPAMRLPELSSETAEEWWGFAEKILLASYPKPQEIPELVTIADKSKRLRPGDCRKSILTKIKARFLKLPRIE